MVQYLTIIGLLLITAGWVAQYFAQLKGQYGIAISLLVLNILGIGILVVDTYLSGAYDIMICEFLTLVGTGLVFLTLKK